MTVESKTKASTSIQDEASMKKIPNLDLAQLKFQYQSSHDEAVRHSIQLKIMELITKDNMAPYYSHICGELKWNVDNSFLSTIKVNNEAELKKWDDKKADAEENLGQTEVLDAMINKADYYCQIGERDLTIQSYKEVVEKTGSLGIKLDVCFNQIRLGFLYMDHELIKSLLEKAKSLIESGGDWDRRNRLKVYEGVYCLTIRNFKTAAELFLDTIATFTCTELLDYKTFIKYTILSSILALQRVDIRKRLIDAPEVLEVLNEIPPFESFMNSFYYGKYNEFFIALASVEPLLKQDRLLVSHYHYVIRELRIKAYAQLLESYRSLTMESMASSFGVSVEFIDKELSHFIALGRLNCVIDKVNGIVETNRPDHKNSQYQATIRQGDLLLNRVQKLSRVIHI